MTYKDGTWSAKKIGRIQHFADSVIAAGNRGKAYRACSIDTMELITQIVRDYAEQQQLYYSSHAAGRCVSVSHQTLLLLLLSGGCVPVSSHHFVVCITVVVCTTVLWCSLRSTAVWVPRSQLRLPHWTTDKLEMLQLYNWQRKRRPLLCNSVVNIIHFGQFG